MTQIDRILLKILNLPHETLASIPTREMKILKNLGKLVASQNFITENQGKLLSKILGENSKNFGDLNDEVLSSLLSPSWSRVFRPLDRTKKIYLSSANSEIIVEFAFSTSLRKVLQGIWKNLGNISQDSGGKIYNVELTEKNIVLLVETFTSYEFDIDEKIMDFYKTIKSWSESEIRGQFLLENISHANFQKAITQDLGLDTPVSDDIIVDRSMRYHYSLSDDKKTEKNTENLTKKLAYRKNTKIWVNRSTYSLEEIFKSLKELNRLPTLVIFDHNDNRRCYEDLVNLSKNLEKNEILENIGIYFRLNNDEHGSNFNKLIAEKKYNAQLDETTKIVGVQNGKIPKFFLKNEWKPMSVISIGSPLKQTKTAAYANCCDLIISYTDQEPIIENRVLWE